MPNCMDTVQHGFRVTLALACLAVLSQLPATSSAAVVSGHASNQAALDCMRTGTETKPDCRKPLPPCPVKTQSAGTGPLVMLPNGVCGMLVDGDTKRTAK